MSDQTPDPQSAQPEDLAAEMEELRRERDDLAQRVEASSAERTRRMRKVTAIVLVVVTAVSLTAAVPGTWVRRTLGNSDRYVATVAPLAQDPAVQEYFARTITAEAFQALGVQEHLSTILTDKAPKLAFLAGPITSSVQSFVQDQVLKLIASPTFQTLWTESNRLAQAQILQVLRGGGDTVSVVNGQVSLNLLPIINQALTQVSAFASNLLGRPITIPPLTGDQASQISTAIGGIEAATGVTLPSNFGQIVLFRSSQLAAVQDAVSLFHRSVVADVIVFFLGLIGALWVSPRRRRTLIQLMAAFAVILVIERRGSIALGSQLVGKAKPENQAALRAVVDRVESSFLHYTGWLLGVALLVLLVAIITGPYPRAVTVRGWVRSLFDGVVGAVRGADTGEAAGWVGTHYEGVMLGGAMVAILLLLVLSLSIAGFLLLGGLLALYEFGVYRIGVSQRPPEEPAA